jgi:UDP-N-acetylmuramate dehydrogenase
MEQSAVDIAELQRLGIRVETPAILSRYSTFRLGGRCRAVWTCSSPSALVAAVRRLKAWGSPWVLLGGGSNVLISDRGVTAVVLRYRGREVDPRIEGEEWVVPASAPLDAVSEIAAQRGWDGLLCCTGIPGTLGGAVVGNAGAWGEQIADRLVTVQLLRRNGSVAEVLPRALEFGYRRSALQTTGDLVLSVRLRLESGDSNALLAKRAEILETRSHKHPDLQTQPCIGSIFRNIEPSSAAERRQAAGWYLDQAGAKTMRVGGARVFEKHANIVVKGPGCTAQDVHDLIDHMASAVGRMFGLRLIREVRYLGRFEGETDPPAGGFY